MNPVCMKTHHRICRTHFSAKTLRALTNKNLFVVSATCIPDENGSYANGQTAYLLSSGEMKTFLEVLELSK